MIWLLQIDMLGVLSPRPRATMPIGLSSRGFGSLVLNKPPLRSRWQRSKTF